MSASAIAVLGTIVVTTGVIMTGVIFVLRALWDIRGSWDATNAGLARLVERVTDIVARKDEDHGRIERRADEAAQRLERHLEWHDKH